mmetsp:Transcript_14096/g.21976  ORF Transcript_14096/g.21976 Transcript_14096/m.21976 type:complete len:83 (+) Transcript_14096:1479-1727(+)
MELDRPILQREKFELIFLEKLKEVQGGSKVDLQVRDIRKAMGDRMKLRKKENKQQLNAFSKMQEFLKIRFNEEKVLPSKDEI